MCIRDRIIPGLEYVIVCQKIITLRIVRTSERDSEWRLVAADRENSVSYTHLGIRVYFVFFTRRVSDAA